MKPERKIVQITTDAVAIDEELRTRITALCNDGSVWRLTPGTYPKWEKLPDIPQE